MLTGKRFRINSRTLVLVQSATGQHATVTIPAGEVVKVVSDPDSRFMLDVLWDGRVVGMFLADLEARGEEVAEMPGARSQVAPARRVETSSTP